MDQVNINVHVVWFHISKDVCAWYMYIPSNNLLDAIYMYKLRMIPDWSGPARLPLLTLTATFSVKRFHMQLYRMKDGADQ